MKTTWIVLMAVLAACAVGAGAMWWSESMRAAGLAQEVAQLKADNAKLTQDEAAANEKSDALESESEQLRAAHALAGVRAVPEASPTPDEDQDKSKGAGAFLSEMFKDPEMRKMLAAQQATALRGFYNDFIKQANMTPDEADKFFQLLQDRQMALMDSSEQMMSGSGIDMKAVTATTSASDDALKQLLGPEQFAQYQDYEKTLGDRIQVQQFSQQLGSVGAPLQDYQSQALIKIMSEEQANMPNLQTPNAAGMQQVMSMDSDQYAQQMDAMNQRVYNRAIAVLTPPQLTAFAAFQKNMATAQVAGLKMARQMYNGGQ